jgi:hypothetical protein
MIIHKIKVHGFERDEEVNLKVKKHLVHWRVEHA